MRLECQLRYDSAENLLPALPVCPRHRHLRSSQRASCDHVIFLDPHAVLGLDLSVNGGHYAESPRRSRSLFSRSNLDLLSTGTTGSGTRPEKGAIASW